MIDSPYFQQAALMVRLLPLVARESCFALKGGTAINFFEQDMPRLSVDIDLTYLPLEDYETTLANIGAALKRLEALIKKSISGVQIVEHQIGKTQRVSKLTIVNKQGRVKIEPNEVLRGSVYPPSERDLTRKAREAFEASFSMPVLSTADIYGGKICAALDRRHPRDLFDMKQLLDQGGITESIRKAFVVYLVCSDRPIHELLTSPPKDAKELKVIFEEDFKGMALVPVAFEDLLSVQSKLPQLIRSSLSDKEKAFIVSVKEANPQWELLGLPGIDRLPGVQWKLMNIRKMDKRKHAQMLANLKRVLEL